MSDSSRQSVLFEGIADKPLLVKFDRPDQSSDAGAVLLKAVDEKLGLTEQFAEALHDRRQPSKVQHELLELVRQRVYGIACGYSNGNDAAKLRNDPVMKIVCKEGAGEDQRLASQPTLSRFENAFRRTDLLRAGYALADAVIAEQKRRRARSKPKRMIIDVDAVADATYGDQQLTMFNDHYGHYCYLPAILTLQFDQESDQHLLGVALRPGNRKGFQDVVTLLKRVVRRVREAFPKARLVVRMDADYGAPEVFDYLEKDDLLYLVALRKNEVLTRLAEPLMNAVRAESEKTQATVTRYGDFRYAANTWGRKRRVVFKAERLVCEGKSPKDNPRFVVTNMDWSARNSYKAYCQRGDSENRIKELVDGLRLDLTSCTDFQANQLRCLLTAASYVLYQQVRGRATEAGLEEAQVPTLRERLVKVAALVQESVRRIWMHLPSDYPWAGAWRRVALACGADTG